MSLLPDNGNYFKMNGEYRSNNSTFRGKDFTVYGDGNTFIRTSNVTAYGNKNCGKQTTHCKYRGDDITVTGKYNNVKGDRPSVQGTGNEVITDDDVEVTGFNNTKRRRTVEDRITGTDCLRLLATRQCGLPEDVAVDMTDEQVQNYVETTLGWPPGVMKDLITKSAPKPPPVIPEYPDPVDEPEVDDDFPDKNRCMICQVREATCAFWHEDKNTAHKIICNSCTQRYRQPDMPRICALCRKPYTHVVRIFGAE